MPLPWTISDFLPSLPPLSQPTHPLTPHPPTRTSSAHSHLICPLAPHLPTHTSSAHSHLVHPLTPHPPTRTSSAHSHLVYPLTPHPPTRTSSAHSHLVYPLTSYPPTFLLWEYNALEVFKALLQLACSPCSCESILCPWRFRAFSRMTV